MTLHLDRARRRCLRQLESELTEEEKRKYLDKFRRFVDHESFFGYMVGLVTPRESLAVLCHGDCWTNNFLFQYAQDGGISQVRFTAGGRDGRVLVPFECDGRDGFPPKTYPSLLRRFAFPPIKKKLELLFERYRLWTIIETWILSFSTWPLKILNRAPWLRFIIRLWNIGKHSITWNKIFFSFLLIKIKIKKFIHSVTEPQSRGYCIKSSSQRCIGLYTFHDLRLCNSRMIIDAQAFKQVAPRCWLYLVDYYRRSVLIVV